MSVLTSIGLGIAVVVVALVAYIATRPDDFCLTRSTTMSARPQTVFALVNDFHEWENWSPWAKLDPNSTAIFEGTSAGEGARFRWSGNKQVGEGAMTITESRPHERIAIKLEFVKPFKATNTAEFTFQPQGDKTAVTWSMFGKNNFMGKAFGLIVDCDKMVGKDFEKGLASMREIAESRETS